MATRRVRPQLAFALLTFIALMVGTSVVQAATITGVTIEDVSSELIGGFNRDADYLIDGSGLTGNQHFTSADGFMWLTSGITGCCGGVPPVEPNGAERGVVTFDLGANYDLTSAHIWNYNEGNGGRGADQVEVLTASSDVAPSFTSLGILSLPVASGGGAYIGDIFPLVTSNVRLLRLNILSAHASDNGFVGLSEVRFDGELALPIPEPSTFLLAALGLLGLLGFTRRRRR